MAKSKGAALDARFAALADPTRRAILERLARGSATVSELAAPFDVSLPAISRHLGVLEDAGFLTRRREGRIHICHLRPEALRDPAKWLARTEAFWSAQLDRLARHLEEDDL